MHSYNTDEAARGEGLSNGVRDALADPIVQALLAARAPRPGSRCDAHALVRPKQGADGSP